MLTLAILACFGAVAHAGTGYYYGPGLSGELPGQNVAQTILRQPQIALPVQHVPKKTLNVMFIMAPQIAAGKNIEVKINGPESETETVIYLLSKQSDASEILQQIKDLQQRVQVRPEVMIIKYRTEEELEHAVKAVQSKYDDLGGPTPLINGGVASVLDYTQGNQLSDH